MDDLRPSQRREVLDDAIKHVYCSSRIRPHEPVFRYWEVLPAKMRDKLKQLKSSDMANVRSDVQSESNEGKNG